MSAILLLHPGEMGAAVAACLRENGHMVYWVDEGRSRASRERARAAALEPLSTLDEAVTRTDIALSICPPHAAFEVVQACVQAGFRGIYVDANAIAPHTARMIGQLLEDHGVRFVDGGIIGPPPHQPGTTRLFLAGADAPAIAALFEGARLECPVLPSPPGAASAVKMCYAAWTKGATALLTAIRTLALYEGVEGALLEEWDKSQPGTAHRSEAIMRDARKAWRWVGEMEEIAATFENARLPGGFHHAAAALYRQLEGFRHADAPVSLHDILEELIRHAGSARDPQL